MRISKYTCNKCGAEIPDDFLQALVEESLTPDGDIDFCPSCFHEKTLTLFGEPDNSEGN
jgi:NAD-dependent SIR2 family protein deacetylase